MHTGHAMPVPTLGVAHVNLNCRALGPNRRFFEALGLSAAIRTDPAPQDCRAFGFAGDARWDAFMLQDGRPGATALDLLEWKEPAPWGRPPLPGTRLGFERLGFASKDIEGARKAVLENGGVASEIHELTPDSMGSGFGATTPDGQALLILAGGATRFDHVSIACSDLDRSEQFYRDVLGMTRAATLPPARLPSAVFRPGAEEAPESVGSEARLLSPECPGPGSAPLFNVLLTKWVDPAPPAAARGLEAPNHLGLFRMALLVADIDACHAQLQELGVPELSPVVTLDLGPSCPAPSCRALFFRDPDGACLELIGSPSDAPHATGAPA